jgi:predicted RecB family nuclease
MREPTPSALGGWSYEVADTKLAQSTKAKFLVQLSFYSQLLEPEQELPQRHMHVVLSDHDVVCSSRAAATDAAARLPASI